MLDVASFVVSIMALIISTILFFISRNDADRAMKINYILPILSKICDRIFIFVTTCNDKTITNEEKLADANDLLKFIMEHQIILVAIGLENELKNIDSALKMPPEKEEEKNSTVFQNFEKIASVCQKKYTDLIRI